MNILSQILNYETKNIDAYLKLKHILEIDDDMFMEILKEVE